MSGMLATDYPHKRSAQAVTMVSKSSVKIADDQVQVDLRLLFQRLIIVCDNSQLEELFQYELCKYPTALFDYPFMLRQPQKPALADALWTLKLIHQRPRRSLKGMYSTCQEVL